MKVKDPVQYMRRTKAYYEAQGFDTPYQYAHFSDVPFAKPTKSLALSTLGLVTTASTYPRAPQEPRQVDTAPIKTDLKLYAGDLSWDKSATHLDDRNSFCPIDSLQACVSEGKIGHLAPHVQCIPTEYSHRATLEHDAPEVHQRLLADGVDVALLVPL